MTPCVARRADALRRRHALRPADLQSLQAPGQLGTRLGCALSHHREAFLGSHQSLRLACRHAAISQSPRIDQGEERPGKVEPRAKRDPNHRTRPELALELIHLVARWFPNDEILISGDSAYGGKSILSYLPPNAHLISHVHPDGALYEQAPPEQEGTKGRRRKKGKRLPKMKQWAEDPNQPWTKLKFNQFGLHASWRSRRSRPCTTPLEVIDSSPSSWYATRRGNVPTRCSIAPDSTGPPGEFSRLRLPLGNRMHF